MEEEILFIFSQIFFYCCCFSINLLVVVLTAWVASSKKRSAIGWGALAFFFPILPLIILLFLPANRPAYPPPYGYTPHPAGYPGQPGQPAAYMPPSPPPAYLPPQQPAQHPVHPVAPPTPAPAQRPAPPPPPPPPRRKVSSQANNETMAYSGPRLIIDEGPDRGKSYSLVKNTRIGRSPENEIVLTDPQISRHHAVVEQQGALAVIRDLGGSNGVYVNGKRISEATRLTPGDIVTIGNTQIRVE